MILSTTLEIRLKSRLSKKWHYKDVLIDTSFISEDGDILDPHSEIDPNSVSQFTGVHDISLKEIYEKDIIQIEEPNTENKIIGWIDYDPSYAAYVLRGTKQAQHEFENLGDYLEYRIKVLGNIVDNPELLP